MEAESEEEGFHGNGGRQKLDDEEVWSKKHKEVAYNVDTMRVKLVQGAGAGAEQPYLFHNHLVTMADSGQQQ